MAPIPNMGRNAIRRYWVAIRAHTSCQLAISASTLTSRSLCVAMFINCNYLTVWLGLVNRVAVYINPSLGIIIEWQSIVFTTSTARKQIGHAPLLVCERDAKPSCSNKSSTSPSSGPRSAMLIRSGYGEMRNYLPTGRDNELKGSRRVRYLVKLSERR